MAPARAVSVGLTLGLLVVAVPRGWAADGVVAYRPTPACEHFILKLVDDGEPYAVVRRIAGNRPIDGQLISGLNLITPGEQSWFNHGAGGGPSVQRLIGRVEAVVDSEHEALRAFRSFCPPPPPKWDGS